MERISIVQRGMERVKNNSEPIELNEFNSRIKKGGWSEDTSIASPREKIFRPSGTPERRRKKRGRGKKGGERKGKGKAPVTCLDHPRDKRGANRARTN